MPLFGYPVAQENDAERAVRAALSIKRALRVEPQEQGYGDLLLPHASRSSPGLLWSMPISATCRTSQPKGRRWPSRVRVVTARVQRQVAGLFLAEERGSHELKGVPEQRAA